MSDAPRRSYPATPELPVGTWSYQPGQLGGFLLWQQTEAGPHYVGSVNSLASADFIVERLNEVSQPASVAQRAAEPLDHIGDANDMVAQCLVSDWLAMFDPPPQIDFQQSDLLQQAISHALRKAASSVTSTDREAGK